MQQKEIKKQITKLKKICASIDAEKLKAVESLIENIAFMAVTLKELQQDITENGAVEEYQNGENQWGKKVSSAAQVYNSMIKNYTSCIKQLIDLLPKEDRNIDDGFEEFLKLKQ